MASEQKEKIIRFYKGTEGEETVVKLVDLAEAVQRSQKFRLSGFLDPFGQEIAETVAANYPDLRVDFNGGYPGAERARAMYIHSGTASLHASRTAMSSAPSWASASSATASATFWSRLIPCASSATARWPHIFCRISRKSAPSASRAKWQTLPTLHRVRSAARKSVRRSLRCASSREIPAEILTNNIYGIDIISMRGRGRLEVAEVRGQTKKGRTVVVLKRYI